MIARFAFKNWSVVDGWVGGWMDGWMGGWMDGCKSRVKDCLQQSKIPRLVATLHLKSNFVPKNDKNNFIFNF